MVFGVATGAGAEPDSCIGHPGYDKGQRVTDEPFSNNIPVGMRQTRWDAGPKVPLQAHLTASLPKTNPL